MPRLEKKFVLSDTIDISNVTYERKSTEVKTHFSIPWCMAYYMSDDRLTLCIDCLHADSEEKWEIETEIKLKVKSSNGTTLQLKNDRCFGNSRESNELSWEWVAFQNLEDVEKYYTENGKFMIEARLKIRKMSGFGKEKLKYFDEHSQKHWDVILSVNDHKFYLLKAYLASQSTYFDRLLFGAFKEATQSEVELKEVDHEDFQSFLELIHGESAVDDTNIDGVLHLADMFDAPTAIRRYTNIDGVLHLADMFDAPTAIRRCEEFLLEKSKWSLDERVKLAERYNLKDLMVILQESSDLC